MRVLQVRLDEPGGGVVYVRTAMESAPAGVDIDEIAIDPVRVRLSPIGWWSSANTIRKAIRRHGPDIIHAHGVRAGAVTILGSMRLDPIRVLTIHGLHSIRRARPWSSPLAHTFNRVVMRRFERALVLSRSDYDSLVDARLVPAERVRLVRTSFEPRTLPARDSARDSIDIARSATVVLWVGRFSAEKDPLTFVRALMDVRVPGSVGLMVGDGPLQARARSLATAKDANILFSGWLEDPAPALAAADVFVSTSRWEGMPVAVLEAAAAGIPLVLSDVPGNRDLIVAGVAATTFPFGDSTALASRLHEVLSEPHRETDTARTIVLNTYNRENLIADLTAVYEELTTPR